MEPLCYLLLFFIFIVIIFVHQWLIICEIYLFTVNFLIFIYFIIIYKLKYHHMSLSNHLFVYQVLIFYQCDWLIISILILICFINMYYPDSASWIIIIYFIITHPFIIYFLIRHIFSSGLPTTMTDVMGVPATAGLPKNLSELAVFNGMPLEHANRVVSTYVLRGIWDVYLYNVLLVAK